VALQTLGQAVRNVGTNDEVFTTRILDPPYGRRDVDAYRISFGMRCGGVLDK
jgi:hypothetical protein